MNETKSKKPRNLRGDRHLQHIPGEFMLVVEQSLDTNLTQNRVMMNTRRIMIGLFEPKDAETRMTE